MDSENIITNSFFLFSFYKTNFNQRIYLLDSNYLNEHRKQYLLQQDNKFITGITMNYFHYFQKI